MHNFNINMPSIPSTSIQFKIQDAKIKGFNSKQSRFKDNFSYLTDHFISSFPNIMAPKSIQHNNKSNLSNRLVSSNISPSFKKESNNFRVIIGDDKKNLLLKYQESYKDYIPQIPFQNKYDKGFSFGKNSIKDTLDSEVQKYPSQALEKRRESSIIDNYYFSNKTQESIDEEDDDKKMLEKRREEKLQKKRFVKKSAVFEAEDRWKSLDRSINSKIKPGPGSYVITSPTIPKTKNHNDSGKNNKQSVLLEKLKEIMENSSNPQKSPKNVTQNVEIKSEKKSSMFADGNLDRFGKPIFPLSPKINVPGPGAYSFSDSLEDKANRILVVQEQRKLLKQWYND